MAVSARSTEIKVLMMNPKIRRLPAEEGLWFFVLADMTVFALFFNIFAYYRGLEPDVFRAGQATLSVGIGVANTLILLCSSWFAVLAMRAVHARNAGRARSFFFAAIVCGLAFAALKLFEYSAKVSAGHTPASDNFYMLYFAFTGIHFLHLIVGVGFLAAMIGLARTTDWNDAHRRYFECGTTYWHMVDALWVVLFPIIYLVR